MTDIIEKETTMRTGSCEVCKRKRQQIYRYWMIGKWHRVCVDAYSCISIYKKSQR